MKIYLDDTRIPLDSYRYTKDVIYIDREWKIAKNYLEFVSLLNDIISKNQFIEIELISFDHDLADEHYHRSMMNSDHTQYNQLYTKFQEKTGLDCVKYLIDVCLDNNFILPKFKVHTQNPVGKVNMSSMLENFKKHQNE